jgi:hypothetical protein
MSADTAALGDAPDPVVDGRTMPEHLAALWDALPGGWQVLLNAPVQDGRPRKHVGNLVRMLAKLPGWDVTDAIALASFCPDGLGCLSTATEMAIREEWKWAAEDAAKKQAADAEAQANIKEAAALRSLLSVESWAERNIPPPDRLLGDLVTPTTRMFLVGRTGLGKTMLALALATGMASGTGFLHWRSARPAKVLIIDGEMPAELIKSRSIDALRRVSLPPKPGFLTIYSRDMEEEIGRRFPMLGTLAPLNTEAGQNFVHALIDALGGIDAIILDNVMSLVAGDQKDEIPWSETLPLVASLTDRRIGQIWLDHTGHNSDRQYGSSTKGWRFDAIGCMTPVPDDQREHGEVAFNLSFDHPGKARRRTPDNWHEFDTCTIRLRDDVWTSTAAGHAARRKVSPKAELFHKALLDALAAGHGPALGRASRADWVAECVRRNLIEPTDATDTHRDRSSKLAQFRKIVSDLQSAGWIGADGDTFIDLTRPYGTAS